MEQTKENVLYCMKLVAPFGYMRFPPPEQRYDGAMKALADTLVAACKTRETAAKIAKDVYRGEDTFPAPATLRKYLRENHVCEDERREEEEELKRISAEQRKAVLRERGEI